MTKQKERVKNPSQEKRRPHTVKQRIFISNALMIMVTFVLIFLINLCVLKVFWESIEQNWQLSMQTISGGTDVEAILKEWTVHQRSFYLLFSADVLICIAIWILVSIFFTRRLAEQIMKPLDALGRGAERIRRNHLTEPIAYQGEKEFEEICNTFNDMQEHLLTEQEKNQKYEKARTEMIAGISHDLRTPLTAVRGSIKAILDDVVKDEQIDRFLQTAYRRTGEMDTLLNQLFYVSKMESGGMTLHLQNVDLFVWLSDYLKEKQKIFSAEEAEFIPEMEPVSGMVQADPEQLHRILDNLLENSRKYSEKKPVCITVSLQKTEYGFSIRFSDNGPGVPEEKLEMIFDEFYRVDESRNRKEGSGLGLYIVKNLMESMGGQVRAENSEGLAIILEFPGEGEDGWQKKKEF